MFDLTPSRPRYFIHWRPPKKNMRDLIIPHTTGHAGPHPAVSDDSLRIVKSDPEVKNRY